MFKVEQCQSYKIVNEQGDFLHSDGTKLPRGEFWPTKEQAQAVLDRHQPKHVWVHGDVFTVGRYPMVYIREGSSVYIYHLTPCHTVTHTLKTYLKDATFLFNIKDKL